MCVSVFKDTWAGPTAFISLSIYANNCISFSRKSFSNKKPSLA